MTKKLAIIGHTKGIGAACAKKFGDQGWEINGFSRSLGWDISWVSITNLVNQICPNDVCIVNAHFEYKQVEICYKLFDLWKDQEKTIVAISSNSNDSVKTKKWPYSVEKSALDTTCLQLSYIPSKCKIINIRPGYVDTERVSAIDAEKINPADLAEVIFYCVNFSSINISNITLLPNKKVK